MTFLILSSSCFLDEIPVASLLSRRAEPVEEKEEEVEEDEEGVGVGDDVVEEEVAFATVTVGLWVVGSMPLLASLFFRHEFQ